MITKLSISGSPWEFGTEKTASTAKLQNSFYVAVV
jgi:hypothetical protein